MSEKTNNSENGAGTASKLLNALGAFAVTVFTAIGLLYVLHSNYLLAGLFSILILVAIMLLSKFLIDNKTKQKIGFGKAVGTTYDDNSSEYVLLGLYAIVALVSLPFIFHFIDIDFSRKAELKSSSVEKVTTINNLLTSYNDKVIEMQDEFETSANTNLSNYKLDTKSAAKDSLLALLGDGEFDIFRTYPNSPSNRESELDELINGAVENKKTNIKNNYALGKFGDKTVENDVSIYTKQAKNIFNNWQMTKVSDKYYDIDIYYTKLLKRINEKMPAFTHTKDTTKDLKLDSAIHSLTNASALTYIIGLFSFLLFHYLVLIEYFKTRRVIADMKRMSDEDEVTEDDQNARIKELMRKQKQQN